MNLQELFYFAHKHCVPKGENLNFFVEDWGNEAVNHEMDLNEELIKVT